MLRLLTSVAFTCSAFALPAMAQTNAEKECKTLAGFFDVDGDVKYVPEIDEKAAEPVCRQAVKDNPADIDNSLYLIRVLDKAERDSEILEVLNTLPGDEPTGKRDYVEAVLHYRGNALSESRVLFSEKMEAAANKGLNIAYLEMADVAQWRGEDDWPTFGTPLSWNEKAYEAGLSGGAFYAGINHESGIGTPVNISEANRWYKLAADMGHREAMSYLGTNLAFGHGAEEDPAAGAEYFRRASELGNAYGTCRLGNLHEAGLGVEQSFQRSADFYEKGFEQNESEGLCLVGLTEAYILGQGREEDMALARYWAEKAADAGEEDGYYYLGLIYLHGLGTTADMTRAIAYFENSTELEDDAAPAELGEMYEMGRGVDKDDGKALEYYRMAADRGNLWAMNRMGEAFRDGDIVGKDLNKSLTYFFTLADNDYEGIGSTLMSMRMRYGTDASLDPELSARLNADNPDWME